MATQSKVGWDGGASRGGLEGWEGRQAGGSKRDKGRMGGYQGDRQHPQGSGGAGRSPGGPGRIRGTHGVHGGGVNINEYNFRLIGVVLIHHA